MSRQLFIDRELIVQCEQEQMRSTGAEGIEANHETARQRLRQKIAQALEEGWTLDEIVATHNHLGITKNGLLTWVPDLVKGGT